MLRFHKLIVMEKIVKIVLISFFVLISGSTSMYAGNADDNANDSGIDWTPVMNAIMQVESGGDRFAKSGNSVGAMQITPICVLECNNILKRRKSKKRFKLSDRFSIAKSKEMFLLLQSVYNPMNSIEKAIRSWNGGLNYGVKKTQRYFEKVMRIMNQNLACN